MSLLIVQGQGLTPDILPALAAAAGVTSGKLRSPTQWVTEVEAPRQEMTSFCTERKLDFSYWDQAPRWNDFALLAMDMDSTLITIECIDELADYAGVKSQVAAITEAAMRGELDFPGALRKRVGLLAGLPEAALESVYQDRLQLSPGAEQLLAGARAAGWKTLLVSGGFTFFTERLAHRLGLDVTLANQLEIESGRLTGRVLGNIVDATAKAQKLTETCAQLGIRTQQAIAIGDGANDLKMLSLAGIGVAYHAKPLVQQQARVAVNFGGLDTILGWFQPATGTKQT